jgi:Cu(I)/Ag(I) efflux system protein CusF
MTKLSTKFFAAALTLGLLTTPALAQMSDHSDHDMSQMDHSKMNHAGIQHGEMSHDAMMEARAAHMIEVLATVNKVDKKKRIVSLAHDAVPAISWPPMTQKFPVREGKDIHMLKKGQRVQFTLHRAADGSLPLVELCLTSSEVVIAGLCAPGMNHGPDHKMMNHDDMKHEGMKH